jgi:hypothetical protein
MGNSLKERCLLSSSKDPSLPSGLESPGFPMVSACRTGSPLQGKSVRSWGLLLHFPRLHSNLWLTLYSSKFDQEKPGGSTDRNLRTLGLYFEARISTSQAILVLSSCLLWTAPWLILDTLKNMKFSWVL